MAKEHKKEQQPVDNESANDTTSDADKSGGNMGAGQSGKENLGSEKPSDNETMGSQKPGDKNAQE